MSRLIVRRDFLLGLPVFAGIAGCRQDTSRPDGMIAGEAGNISRVNDGDSLSLDTGLTVRLAGIEAPRKAWRDRQAEPLADEASDMLVLAALGRKCQLYYGGLTRDRYDRALAHVIVQDETGNEIWLNGMMVEQGGARVRTWADNSARVDEMLAFERNARSEKMGIWSHEFYQVLNPEELPDADRGLAIVEGQISQLSEVLEADSKCEPDADGRLRISLGLALVRSNARKELEVGQIIRVRSGVRRTKNEAGDYAGDAYLSPDHWAQFETNISKI